MNKSTGGFTIVELLIVIIVIAILAAISAVAYAGVQNSANDTAVKSDLANLSRKIQLYHAEKGYYPEGGRATEAEGLMEVGSHSQLAGVNFRATQSAYGVAAPTTLGYCTNGTEYRILAKSGSGRHFEQSSESGLVDRGSAFVAIYGHLALCSGIDFPRSFSYANNSSSSNITTWHSWASS